MGETADDNDNNTPEAKALLKTLWLTEGEALTEGPSRTLKEWLEHCVEQR